MLGKKNKPQKPREVSLDISKPDGKLLIWLAARFATSTTRLRIYRRIEAPVSAGVNVRTAVGQLYQRSAFKSETETSAIILRYLLYSMSHGKSVSQGLEPFIPLNEQLLIKSGEDKGDLAGALSRASNLIVKMNKVNSTIQSAVAKPMLLLTVLVFMIFIVGSFVLPKIAAVFPMDRWTGGAASLATVAKWVNSPIFLYSVGTFIALIIVVLLSRKRWSGFGRNFADKLPPYNFYRVQQGAAWLSTLSSMLQAGRSIKGCLKDLYYLSERNKNRYISSRTLKIIRENELGAENVGYAMEEAGDSFPDAEVIADLVMRSSLSNFDEQISMIAEEWVENSLETVQKAASVLMMLSLLALGSFIGMFILGVISLNTQIGADMQGF